MIIKVVNDELIDLLGSQNDTLNLKGKSPTLILMVGLQGSGKTTSSAKLANWIIKHDKKSYDGFFRYLQASCAGAINYFG